MSTPVTLSNAAKEAMHGIEMQKKIMATLKFTVETGTRSAIWEALRFCSLYQLIHPEWLRQELELIEQGVRTGVFDTFDTAFGVKLPSKGKRQRAHQMELHRDAVIELLFSHRSTGGSLNAEEAFEPVAQQLKISRKLVERIYKAHGRFVKDIPQAPPTNTTIGYASSHSPPFKQFGRPVYWEDETKMAHDKPES